MGKIIKQTTGYLSEINRKNNSQKYNAYLNRPGIIIVGESQNKYPGKRFIYIFFNNDFSIDSFHTSCGTVEEADNKLIFTSDHSKYVFVIDEECIENKTKQEILLNIFNEPSMY